MRWLLSTFVVLNLWAEPPVQLPTYRAVDAEPVPVHIALSQRKGGKNVPWSGLTRDDFVVILEKKEFGAESVDENPDKPGRRQVEDAAAQVADVAAEKIVKKMGARRSRAPTIHELQPYFASQAETIFSAVTSNSLRIASVDVLEFGLLTPARGLTGVPPVPEPP